jgi:23S rRNA pseudouridine1911/1915/1917 synthase
MTQFVINLDDADKRLDHFVTLKFPNLSRSQLKKLIEDGFVLVNGNKVKSGFNLRANDIVESRIEEYEVAPAFELEAQDIPLEIIYEDDDLLVINKNATMVVHPGHGNERDTLVNALLFHCKGKISKLGGDDRPGIVHRLDKGTSGLIVCAKTDLAHRHLEFTKQFAGFHLKKKKVV